MEDTNSSRDDSAAAFLGASQERETSRSLLRGTPGEALEDQLLL